MKAFIVGRQSYLLALAIVVVVVVWVASGNITDDGKSAVITLVETSVERQPVVQVRVRTLRAAPVTRSIVIHGRTEPARVVTLRAETDGRVVELLAERGARVEAGQVLLRLDARDREARLGEARAAVKLRELEYKGAKSLQARELQSETFVAQSLANLESARASLKRIEVEIENTFIAAPFDGVLGSRAVEVGDFVQSGDNLARVLERDPILVTGSVSQNEVHEVQVGARGTARLVTGQEVEGYIRFIEAEADEATRTFRVELLADNPNGDLLPGITSEIQIASRSVEAHFVSPALLSLNEADQLGVKTIEDKDRVVFRPVDIVRAGSDGLWVSGLPTTVQVITVGQGFVRDGEQVRPVPEEGEAAADDGGGTAS